MAVAIERGNTLASTAFEPSPDPLVSSVLAVLKAAAEEGCEINRTKLAKLLYLADLRAVENGETQVTGATWRWSDHGPFDDALYRTEETLAASQLIERRDERQYAYFSRGLKLVLDIDDPLSPQAMDTIRRTVKEHGAKTATALRDLSYRTPPMVEAQAGGEREVLLDLNRARRARQARDLRERYRRHRSARQIQADDPGVVEDLKDEVATSSDRRLRANTLVLGDE